MKKFHGSHYNPGNALVYLVGDIPLDQMKEQLTRIMGSIPMKNAGSDGGKPPISGLLSAMGFPAKPDTATATEGIPKVHYGSRAV